MKKITGILCVLFLLLTSCMQKESGKIQLIDSYGRDIQFSSPVVSIVSAAPNITEAVYALGLENLLVGRTDYCDYPAEAAEVTSIGTITDPSLETIVALAPDVVIASDHFKEGIANTLEAAGIRVLVLKNNDSFEGIYYMLESIAYITGDKSVSKPLVAAMKKKVTDVSAKVKDLAKPTVYYVVGYGEWGDYTAGGDTFINDLIVSAGGINAASDLTGWAYNLESLVAKDPNILICSKYWDAKQGITDSVGYKNLTAVQEGRLLEIDNNLIDRQGPRLADGLMKLAELIHPEAF